MKNLTSSKIASHTVAIKKLQKDDITWAEPHKRSPRTVVRRDLTITPAPSGYNVVRPSLTLAETSGIRAGDPIRFGRQETEDGITIVIEKFADSVFRARPYKSSVSVEYCFREDLCPTGLPRGKRIAFPDAVATVGRIVIPLGRTS